MLSDSCMKKSPLVFVNRRRQGGIGSGKGKTDLLLVANGPCIPGTPLVVRDTGIFLNFWGYPAAPCLPCLKICVH